MLQSRSPKPVSLIGPNPVTAAMGDKIESKKAAPGHVSTVPGHLGVIENDKRFVKIADGSAIR